MAGKCKKCGYQAGIFNLTNGICEPCYAKSVKENQAQFVGADQGDRKNSLEGSGATSQSDYQQIENTVNTPLYFAVSPFKFVVMSIFTFGAYELYWFYKNWTLINEREDFKYYPVLRAFFFPPFYCYSFFKRVQVSAETIPLEVSISPIMLTIGWVMMFYFNDILPDPYGSLVFYFNVFALLPVQLLANIINDTVAPNHDKNGKFTGWNILSVLTVPSLTLLIIFLLT